MIGQFEESGMVQTCFCVWSSFSSQNYGTAFYKMFESKEECTRE